MLTNKRLLISTYIASVPIAAHMPVAQAAADDQVKPAAAGDASLGVSTEVAAVAGERCDVTLLGVSPVRYGATVTAGQRLKADANGAAIPASAGDIAVGIALVAGVAGDIGSVLLGR